MRPGAGFGDHVAELTDVPGEEPLLERFIAKISTDHADAKDLDLERRDIRQSASKERELAPKVSPRPILRTAFVHNVPSSYEDRYTWLADIRILAQEEFQEAEKLTQLNIRGDLRFRIFATNR